jgi:hypothetical protein
VVFQVLAYFLFSIYAYVGRIEMTGNVSSLTDEFEHIDKADVAFSTHAFLLSSIILVQSLILPRGFVGD